MVDRSCTHPLHVLQGADACHVATCRFNVSEDTEGHRCSLLYAERGGLTLDEIAALLHVSRERIRQIEVEAFEKKSVRALIIRLGLAPDDFEHAEAS